MGGGGGGSSAPPVMPNLPIPAPAMPGKAAPEEPVSVVPTPYTGGFTDQQMSQLPGVRLQLSLMPRNSLYGQFFPASMQSPSAAFHPSAPAQAPQQNSAPMSLAPNFTVQQTMNDGSQVLSATAPKGGMFANGQWYPEGASIFGFYKDSKDGPVQYIQPDAYGAGGTNPSFG